MDPYLFALHQREFRWLCRRLGARRSKGRVPTHCFLIRGDTGLGKTSLAVAIVDAAAKRGWSVVSVQCYAQGQPFAGHLWHKVCQALFERASWRSFSRTGLAAQFASLLLLFLQSGGKLSWMPTLSQKQRWKLSEMALRAICRYTSLCVVIDDIHWTDQESLAFFEHLAQHTWDIPLFLLATYHPYELPHQHVTQTALSRLRRLRAVITLPLRPLS